MLQKTIDSIIKYHAVMRTQAFPIDRSNVIFKNEKYLLIR